MDNPADVNLEILKHSTSRSLVLLDEVGAGTNPLEGAALGMSLLESLAESGPLLTIATTHHGELKTLKYSNEAFENACMEFDEVNLKPTYRILWGVPGSSNAIKIAERLGLPNVILGNARELYGAGSAEINEVILEMERLKQNLGKHVNEAQNYLNVTQCKFKVGEFQRTRMRATRTYLRRRIKRWRKRMARYASSGQENKKATLDT